MKCSDRIAEIIAGRVKHVFAVSGGACLHMIHSIAARDDVKVICPQHEQSASFAADAYARLTGMGCALVTSGPGATNLITGIASSFYDSVPVIYLSGNQTRERLGEGLNVRQYGFQCTPICEMVKPITKYAATVMDPSKAAEMLVLAWLMATKDRPGPVLLDIPDDVARAEC